MASSPITSWQIDEETMETVTDFIFLGSKITADDEHSHEIKRCLFLGRKAMTNLDSILKSKDIAKTCLSSQSYRFSSSHVWVWKLDYKESWALKNWCFWTMTLEMTLESPLDCKEIKLVNPKGNQSWIFTGSTDAGIPSWLRQEVSLQSWRPMFDPWVGKISWRRKWQPTPVFLPEKFHG